MKRLFMLFFAMLMMAAIAGCNSSTGDDDDNGPTTNGTGNGGTLTVSGAVKLTSATGAGISGATLVLTSVTDSTTTLTVTTGANGEYAFSNIASGNYLVMVSKNGYTFDPDGATVAVTTTNVTVTTFVGTATNTGTGTFTVSGSVNLTSAVGAGISGATVVLTSVSTTPLTTTTNANGDYTFSNVAPGSYYVAVSKDGYTFSPELATVTVSTANADVQVFIGTAINTGGNAGSNTLYPLKTNATWTYASHNSFGAYSYDETVTNTVSGTTSLSSVNYWVIDNVVRNSDNEIEEEDDFNLRVADDILYSYFVDFYAKTVPAAAKTAFRTARVAADDYIMFKFGVSAGTTWTVYTYSGSYSGVTYTANDTGKYIGTETVGSYANCAKYEITIETTQTTGTTTVAYRTITTYWLAPNVGPVKVESVYYTGDTLATATLLTTTTNTLTSYNIP